MQDWRTEINAEDFFGHQRKKLALADRRPVNWTASSMVGPGIGSGAVRITDFNDLLAMYNGYYSANADALNSPNDDEAFIGFTVMDPELGGRQVFTGFESGAEYTRLFIRNPSDPDFVVWGPWTTDERVPATVRNSASGDLTALPISTATFLAMPPVDTTGLTTYSSSGTELNVLRAGVYSGSVKIEGFGAVGYSQFSAIVRRLPTGTGTVDLPEPLAPVPFAGGVLWPFLFSVTVPTEAVQFSVTQTQNGSGGAFAFISHLQITRLGEAA